jgi:hypothetical protein
MGEAITPSDAQNKLEDQSGIVLQPGQNPYAAFIGACNGGDNVSTLPLKRQSPVSPEMILPWS